MWENLIGAGATLLGSALNSEAQRGINSQNEKLQKEFAQNSIQWKVEDARRAGIHPLAALGAQTYSASPSAVGASNGIAEAGQQISQGLQNSLNKDAEKLSKLQVRDAELEILKKEKELAQMGQALNGNTIFGSPLGDSLVQKPNGSAPTSGLPSSPSAAQQEFNKNFKIGQSMQMSPLPGGKGYFLSFDPESIQGQAMSEGGVLPPVTATSDFYRILDDKLFDEVESVMREQGALKPGFRIDRNYSNLSPYGFFVNVVPENKATKQFSVYSPAMREAQRKRWEETEQNVRKFMRRRRSRGSFLRK